MIVPGLCPNVTRGTRLLTFLLSIAISLSISSSSPAGKSRDASAFQKRKNGTSDHRNNREGRQSDDNSILVFSDEFDDFDTDVWSHEITFAGRTNGEFQMYDDRPWNTYVKNGVLYIRPTVLADVLGENFLRKGRINLGRRCTDPDPRECVRDGKNGIISPIVSARINTKKYFSYKYGKLEVRAKLPQGDWIWPAVWLLPKSNVYGNWPKSGEIDIFEARGNKKLEKLSTLEEIGNTQFGSTLHFGLNRSTDAWREAHFVRNNGKGFNSEFHTYGLTWTPEFVSFSLNGETIGTVVPPDGGFWQLADLDNEGDKIWSNNKISPFDQEFYIVMNVAIGGTSGYFPDNTNPRKPWNNSDHYEEALDKFWQARGDWLHTWNGEDSALQIDYVRVWEFPY